MSVLYDDVQMGPITSQEYKTFEIHVVTIQISMTEYHHWINGQAHHLLFITQQSMWENESGKSSHLSIFTLKHLMVPLKHKLILGIPMDQGSDRPILNWSMVPFFKRKGPIDRLLKRVL